MGVKAKISVDDSELQHGLQRAEAQAKKTGQALNKNLNNSNITGALDKVADGADNAVRALDSVAGAAGMASTGFSGLAGDIIALVKSPIALLIASLGTLVALGVKVWDSMTLSLSEHISKLDFLTKKNKELYESQKKEANFYKELLNDFIKLNNTFPKTAILLAEQQMLLGLLKNRYGDLGVTLDKTTMSYTNLHKAMLKIEEAENKKKIDASSKILNTSAQNANLQFKQYANDNNTKLNTLAQFKNLEMLAIDPNSPATGFAMAGKNYLDTKKYINQKGLDIMLLPHSKSSEAEQEAIKSWNKSSVKTDGLVGKLPFLKLLFNNAKTEDEIEKLKSLIELIENVSKEYRKNFNLKAFGKETADELIKDTQKQFVEYTKVESDFEKFMKSQEKFSNEYNEKTSLAFFDGSLTEKNEKELEFYDKKIKENIAEINTLTNDFETLNKKRTKLNQEIAELTKQTENFKLPVNPTEADLKKSRDFVNKTNQISFLRESVGMIDKQLKDKFNERSSIYQTLFDNTQKFNSIANLGVNFYNDKHKNLAREIELKQYELNDTPALSYRAKLKWELEDKGIKLVKEDLDKLLEAQQKYFDLQKGIKYKNSRKQIHESHVGMLNNLKSQALSAAGRTKEAIEFDNINQAIAMSGGRSLTLKEKQRIKALTELQYQMNNLNNNAHNNLRGTLSNELAARGGFSSSVVRDSKRDINYQLLAKNTAAVDLLTRIEKAMNKYGVIQ